MKFKTLYADPPWHFDDKLDPTRHKPYETLTIDDLLKLNISDAMHEEAHLYLWSTSSHIHEALHLMDAWDFEYKTIIPWIKKTKEGKWWFGMGHYFRAVHEPCLFGVRGGLKTNTKNTRNFLIAKAPDEHSSKPPEMYRLIEKQSPGPYLELFSRNKRNGWIMLGNEIDGLDIRESIKKLDKINNIESPKSTLTYYIKGEIS
jgi:N6-adenosine-specific RNA methylase IME4